MGQPPMLVGSRLMRFTAWVVSGAGVFFGGLLVAYPSGRGPALLKAGLLRPESSDLWCTESPAEAGAGFWQPGAAVDALRPLYEADRGRCLDAPVTITILYDMAPAFNGAEPDYGFAALIEGTEEVILYDCGRLPEVLLRNAAALGKSLRDVDVLVISHTSDDHIDGVRAFAEVGHRPVVYAPSGIAREWESLIRRHGSELHLVDGPMRLMKGVYTTGRPPQEGELALLIATPQGPVHLLSCGHIGRVPFIDAAMRLAGEPIYLDLGGFCSLSFLDISHMRKRQEWARMATRGPMHVGFLHCAPPDLRDVAAADWPDWCLTIGAGGVIGIPTGGPQRPVLFSPGAAGAGAPAQTPSPSPWFPCPPH